MFKTQNTAFKIEENLSAENKLQVLCNINKIQISWGSWKRINEIRQQTYKKVGCLWFRWQ